MNLLLSAIKAEDAKIAREVDEFKKLDSDLNKQLAEESKKVEDLQKELEVWFFTIGLIGQILFQNLRSGDWEDLEDWHSDDPDFEVNQSINTVSD